MADLIVEPILRKHYDDEDDVGTNPDVHNKKLNTLRPRDALVLV